MAERKPLTSLEYLFLATQAGLPHRVFSIDTYEWYRVKDEDDMASVSRNIANSGVQITAVAPIEGETP